MKLYPFIAVLLLLLLTIGYAQTRWTPQDVPDIFDEPFQVDIRFSASVIDNSRNILVSFYPSRRGFLTMGDMRPDDVLSLRGMFDGTWKTIVSTPPLVAGRTYDLTLVYDGNEYSLRLDGDLVDSGIAPPMDDHGGTGMMQSSHRPWEGQIDSVSIQTLSEQDPPVEEPNDISEPNDIPRPLTYTITLDANDTRTGLLILSDPNDLLLIKEAVNNMILEGRLTNTAIHYFDAETIKWTYR